MFLKGKKGLVIGIANNRSIAYGIAKSCKEQGASMAYTYISSIPKIKDKVVKAVSSFDNSEIVPIPLDVSNQVDMESLANSVSKQLGDIDFIVHSIAYAPANALKGSIIDITKDDFNTAMEISVFSFIDVIKRLKPILNPNSSLLTISYLGSQNYIPNYNLMGIAKAALESSVRYLAYDLGRDSGMRVNAISAGPIKTLAGSGIADFNSLINVNKANSAIADNVTIEQVGNSGAYLLSDLSSGVTGEVHYVDYGYNVGKMHSESKE